MTTDPAVAGGPVPPTSTLNAQSSRAFRLLYVIDSLGHGGAEQSLVEMLPEYRTRSVSTIIICLVHRDTELVRRAEISGAKVLQAPSANMAVQTAWLRAAIRSLRPDLIHTTLFRADLVGRAASMGTGVPVLTSLVNSQYGPARLRESSIPAWKLRIAQELERWSGRLLTDHFHVNSEAVRAAAAQHLSIDGREMTVIPRGRDPERFSPEQQAHSGEVRALLGLDAEAELIITVGRQEPQKGQVYLVEAFSQIVRQRPLARLVLAGADGAASAGLLSCIREHGLTEKVLLLGRRDDIPDLLGAADVFVLASLWEGLPNVIIEAMATGLPVVATDIAPVREAVDPGRSALLAAPADADSLAEALVSLLKDESLRRKMGDDGREVFLERFTIGPVADKMVALYHEIAAKAE